MLTNIPSHSSQMVTKKQEIIFSLGKHIFWPWQCLINTTVIQIHKKTCDTRIIPKETKQCKTQKNSNLLLVELVFNEFLKYYNDFYTNKKFIENLIFLSFYSHHQMHV